MVTAAPPEAVPQHPDAVRGRKYHVLVEDTDWVAPALLVLVPPVLVCQYQVTLVPGEPLRVRVLEPPHWVPPPVGVPGVGGKFSLNLRVADPPAKLWNMNLALPAPLLPLLLLVPGS
jgi:hypothetical protein